MSITITGKQENDRGCYFEFTGDGSTTILPTITHASLYNRPAPRVTATIFTTATPTRTNGGPGGPIGKNTGLLGNHGGTAVVVASATHAKGITTITLNAAATNSALHFGEITFDDYQE